MCMRYLHNPGCPQHKQSEPYTTVNVGCVCHAQRLSAYLSVRTGRNNKIYEQLDQSLGLAQKICAYRIFYFLDHVLLNENAKNPGKWGRTVGLGILRWFDEKDPAIKETFEFSAVQQIWRKGSCYFYSISIQTGSSNKRNDLRSTLERFIWKFKWRRRGSDPLPSQSTTHTAYMRVVLFAASFSFIDPVRGSSFTKMGV
jgi:hypothetical protein